MDSLGVELQEARARQVTVSKEALTVDLLDGRTIIVQYVQWVMRQIQEVSDLLEA